MNDNRRNRLKGAIELLSEAGDIVEEIEREEQDALDNLPDSIQAGERGEAMTEVANQLYDIETSIDQCKTDLGEITNPGS